MKRPRPFIPLGVRVQVAERELSRIGIVPNTTANLAERLRQSLVVLFGTQKFHLDHDPALRIRKFNPRTGIYTPRANDPDYLIYRTAEDHRRKTLIRGDGAQFPDRVLINRERKRERPPKPKAKIANRSAWPPRGSRPLRSRPFQQ